MIWNGKDIKTLGDLMDAVLAITNNNDQAEADRFMALYKSENDHAVENVGYLSGYCDPVKMIKVQAMFGVQHPIFG